MIFRLENFQLHITSNIYPFFYIMLDSLIVRLRPPLPIIWSGCFLKRHNINHFHDYNTGYFLTLFAKYNNSIFSVNYKKHNLENVNSYG